VTFALTDEIRAKITSAIEAGLVSGVGNPVPGEMCIESAICYALGEPHGDKPSCVATPDREWFIRLNDAAWPSNEERSRAFLPIAFAQLGTAGTSRREWIKRVTEGTIRRVLPLSMRLTAEHLKEGEIKTKLLEAAARCERDGDAASARSAREAWRAADAAAAYRAAYGGVAAAAAAAADAAYRADVAAYRAVAAAAAAAADAAGSVGSVGSVGSADARVARLRVLHEAIAVAHEAYRAEGRAS